MRIFDRQKPTDNDPYCGIAMGDEAKDTLSGFTGVVIARSEHLTGCNQLYVLPASDNQNEMKKGEWFDIERLEKVADKVVEMVSRHTGADIPPPRTTGQAL